ncbi:MAG TPA: DNA replication and repair protein RecF [Thermoanaerobaculia bacterium]
MILHSLATRGFRNLIDAQHQFHPRANLLVGDNGQGKTNFLEAIYFLATTKSFRTTTVRSLLRIGQERVFARGAAREDSIEKQASVGIDAGDERRRELLVNGQKVSFQQYISTLNVLAYSSARLEILRGGPEERRRFLDRGIASVHPAYLQDLSRYQRAVKQRNALLQKIASGSAASELRTWDEEVVVAARPILEARENYAAEIAKTFKEVVQKHRYHIDSLEIEYKPNGFAARHSIEEDLATLRRLRARETALGYTLAGPHRDNLEFRWEGSSASEILSSGEIKTVVLFLKLAKIELFRARFDRPPIFLLDDIDAELDLGIIQRLLAYLLETTQLFTTSAKVSVFRLLDVGEHAEFAVMNGTLRNA